MRALRIAVHGAFTAFGFSLALAACSPPAPSVTPLSAPVAPPPPPRVSSSRAVEVGEQNNEESQEITLGGSDSDDGDDGNSSRSSSRSDHLSSSRPLQSATDPVASSCTESSGAAPDCALLPRAQTCVGASIARRACESFGPLLEPNIGAQWMSCLGEHSDGPAACESKRVVDCGFRAIQSACVDGTFHDTCAQIAKQCADVAPEITAPVCERILGAWKPEGRPKMVECLSHGCETGGFGACLP